jgi:hypothetical protein
VHCVGRALCPPAGAAGSARLGRGLGPLGGHKGRPYNGQGGDGRDKAPLALT